MVVALHNRSGRSSGASFSGGKRQGFGVGQGVGERAPPLLAELALLASLRVHRASEQEARKLVASQQQAWLVSNLAKLDSFGSSPLNVPVFLRGGVLRNLLQRVFDLLL